MSTVCPGRRVWRSRLPNIARAAIRLRRDGGFGGTRTAYGITGNGKSYSNGQNRFVSLDPRWAKSAIRHNNYYSPTIMSERLRHARRIFYLGLAAPAVAVAVLLACGLAGQGKIGFTLRRAAYPAPLAAYCRCVYARQQVHCHGQL